MKRQLSPEDKSKQMSSKSKINIRDEVDFRPILVFKLRPEIKGRSCGMQRFVSPQVSLVLKRPRHKLLSNATVPVRSLQSKCKAIKSFHEKYGRAFKLREKAFSSGQKMEIVNDQPRMPKLRATKRKHEECVPANEWLQSEESADMPPPAKRPRMLDDKLDEPCWKQNKLANKIKWESLVHNGPMFPPPYDRLPQHVHFYYNGKEVRLSEAAEEAASFYAKLMQSNLAVKQQFRKNFFAGFKKTMTLAESSLIVNFNQCDFSELHEYYKTDLERRRHATAAEKRQWKTERDALVDRYGYCLIDGRRERIANYCVEPPGIFRGRGEHPKMGMLKQRIQPEDVTINCSADCNVPVPPKGHQWKAVRHDNSVAWLASWTDRISGRPKYILLSAISSLKRKQDIVKFENARTLGNCIEQIRATYRSQWCSAEELARQLSVALYFIDRLALRTGHEKDEDQADTVGCCSLRVEHVTLHDELDGNQCVVVLDFLGKDSIRYCKDFKVEPEVFYNLKMFMRNKQPADVLFHLVTASRLNNYLKRFMEGLTARVFRTYNASKTLQAQLELMTVASMSLTEKLQVYTEANRAVAVLCNHQRTVPKGHDKCVEKLNERIGAKREAISLIEQQLAELENSSRTDGIDTGRDANRLSPKQLQLNRLRNDLRQLEVRKMDKEACKNIALNTSKLNYLDPRISVTWCKFFGVPISKIYNQNLRNKFAWALDEETFQF